MTEDIYGGQAPRLTAVMRGLMASLERLEAEHVAAGGEKLYEHLSCRLKREESVREKLRRKGLAETPENALRELRDLIGVRVVTLFIDDVYQIADMLRKLPGARVAEEKDYIRDAKPNGYRSYHLILEMTEEDGYTCFAEVQLRTIAMDTWAALEHEMKYKKSVRNQEIIIGELRRCANELAACDVSMQTLRRIIREL